MPETPPLEPLGPDQRNMEPIQGTDRISSPGLSSDMNMEDQRAKDAIEDPKAAQAMRDFLARPEDRTHEAAEFAALIQSYKESHPNEPITAEEFLDRLKKQNDFFASEVGKLPKWMEKTMNKEHPQDPVDRLAEAVRIINSLDLEKTSALTDLLSARGKPLPNADKVFPDSAGAFRMSNQEDTLISKPFSGETPPAPQENSSTPPPNPTE